MHSNGFGQDPTARTRMKCRRRPLHTWGVSAIAVSHKAYMKARDLNEPLALMAKRLLSLPTHMVSYILRCVQHFWLAIFFFVDECILALENIVETVFPSSKHVFDRVDEAVEIIEALPGKFDDVLVEFPVIIKQVPFLDRGLCLAISWLNLLRGFVNTEEKQTINGGVSELKVGHNKVGCEPEAKTNQNKAKLPKNSHNVSEKKTEHIEVKLRKFLDVGTDYNEAQLSTEYLSIAYRDEKKPGKKFGKMVNSSAAKGKYKDVLKSKSKGTYKDVSKSKSKSKGTYKDMWKSKPKQKGTYKYILKPTGLYRDILEGK
ncbi:hypothetical protein GQ457_03G009170 [Hibiscus cannabinus]